METMRQTGRHRDKQGGTWTNRETETKIATGRRTGRSGSVLEIENLSVKQHPKQNNFPLYYAQLSDNFSLFSHQSKYYLLPISQTMG